MFFLYILSNEKTRIPSKATDTNSQWPQQGSPPTIPRLTTDLLRMKWWNESQEEAEPSTLQQVPDLRWHNYVHVAAFICSSGRGTKISQRLWIPQMCNICCWADLLAGLVFLFFLLPSVTTWQILHSAFVYCWSSNKRSWWVNSLVKLLGYFLIVTFESAIIHFRGK